MAENKSTSYDYTPGSASASYEKLVTKRSPYLQRAEDMSKLTIASIMLPEGSSGSTAATDAYQSVGARGTKNLASKLLLALMPPNQSFFRFAVDGKAKKELQKNKEQWTAIEEALGEMERICTASIEARALRVTMFELLLQLIITGNVVLHIPKKGPACIYNLRQFIVVRQHNGTVLKLIIKEMIAKSALTAPQKSVLDAVDLKEDEDNPSYGIEESEVCAYTCMERTADNWKVYQEIKGKLVPESDGTYPLDAPAFIPVRWRKIDGESYGRSFCDEVSGDLTSVEGLTQSCVEGAAGMAKLMFLVNPNGNVRKEDLEGNNLDVIDGEEKDVTVLQANKAGDLGFAKEMADGIEKRLELAFLLNTAVQRDAERVTAEEIRFVAQELEDTLGGIYSIQSLELQVPVISRVMKLETADGSLPVMPGGSLTIQIVAGLEALGRSHELVRLDSFVSNIGQTFGPENVSKYINVRNYLARRATALALETKDLLNTQEQIDANELAAQQTEVGKTVGPELVKQMGNNAAASASAPQPTK